MHTRNIILLRVHNKQIAYTQRERCQMRPLNAKAFLLFQLIN